jgi:hypothetical protein
MEPERHETVSHDNLIRAEIVTTPEQLLHAYAIRAICFMEEGSQAGGSPSMDYLGGRRTAGPGGRQTKRRPGGRLFETDVKKA